MAAEEGGLKGCLLVLGIGAVAGVALFAVWRAQSSGTDEFEASAGLYFDALVAGDYVAAAAADHPNRAAEAEVLQAAWDAREVEWGQLESWNLHVASPGSDGEGAFVRAKVQLSFEKRSLVVVAVRLRPVPEGELAIQSVKPTARGVTENHLW